jgi:hypothetical protein
MRRKDEEEDEGALTAEGDAEDPSVVKKEVAHDPLEA